MADSEELTSSKGECRGDFPSMCMDLCKKINFKVGIFLFIIGIFLFSDTFIYTFLPKSMVDGDCVNTKGTIVQLIIFIIFYFIIDLFSQCEII